MNDTVGKARLEVSPVTLRPCPERNRRRSGDPVGELSAVGRLLSQIARAVNRRARLTRSRRPKLTNEKRLILLELLGGSGNSPGLCWTPVSAEIWSMFDAGLHP